MKLRNFIFGVVFFVVLGCASVVLAKENGMEECDTSLREKIANDANYIKANLAPTLLELKSTAEDLIKSQKLDYLIPDKEAYEASKREYDESVRRFLGRNSRSKLKND